MTCTCLAHGFRNFEVYWIQISSVSVICSDFDFSLSLHFPASVWEYCILDAVFDSVDVSFHCLTLYIFQLFYTMIAIHLNEFDFLHSKIHVQLWWTNK